MISIYEENLAWRKILVHLTSSFSNVNLSEMHILSFECISTCFTYNIKHPTDAKNCRIITTYIYFDSFIHKICKVQLIYELTCVLFAFMMQKCSKQIGKMGNAEMIFFLYYNKLEYYTI